MSNEKEVYSWIFLAIGLGDRKSPASLDEVIGFADAINHAIPSHKELQNSFGWLLKQNLILKEGKKYRVADKGIILLDKADATSNFLLEQWKYLEKQFAFLNSDTVNDSLTVEETSAAYRKYNKRFWKEYKNLFGEDK